MTTDNFRRYLVSLTQTYSNSVSDEERRIGAILGRVLHTYDWYHPEKRPTTNDR